MINLLSIEEKKRIARDARFRIFIVYFYVIGFCFLIAGISLSPVYILASVQENLANQRWAAVQQLPVSQPDKETMAAIKDINTKISVIQEIEKSKFLVLENAFDEVVKQKMPDIKLSSISFSKDADGKRQITLEGLAPNRERLLLFRQALEADTHFASVDLPISNFVKGANINFTLSLTLAAI